MCSRCVHVLNGVIIYFPLAPSFPCYCTDEGYVMTRSEGYSQFGVCLDGPDLLLVFLFNRLHLDRLQHHIKFFYNSFYHNHSLYWLFTVCLGKYLGHTRVIYGWWKVLDGRRLKSGSWSYLCPSVRHCAIVERWLNSIRKCVSLSIRTRKNERKSERDEEGGKLE